MIISKNLQWPITQASFIDRELDGLLFHPLFITHYSDVWLFTYVNDILNYSCGMSSEFQITCKSHTTTTNKDKDHWDQLIYYFLSEIKPKTYLYNNINAYRLQSVAKKLNYDKELPHLYHQFGDRIFLKDNLRTLRHKNKTRNIEYSFIITTNREPSKCYIDEIIEKISSFQHSSYEIIIFSSNHKYDGKHVLCLQEEDFGATWGYNRCYQESAGQFIVELTDCSIPDISILNFKKFGYVITSSVNKTCKNNEVLI